MIKNKIVRGIFLIVACSAAAALISCQDGGTAGPEFSKTGDEIVRIHGDTYNFSIQPPQKLTYVDVSVDYTDGFSWVHLWDGNSGASAYYTTGDFSDYSGKWVWVFAEKDGFGPYSAQVYVQDGPTRHDIYMGVAP
jgi:hypothetical protein